MKLMHTNERTLNYVSALVFGDSGIGKTTSLRTLPVDSTLIAVCERSVVPLRECNLKMLHIESWDDVRKLLQWIRKPDEIQDAEVKAAVSACKFVVIDSLSEVANLCIADIIGVERKKLLADRKKDAPDRVYEEQMTMEDWGLYRTRINNMVSAYCHLPRHVIMTALAAWKKDKQECETFRVPNLSGKAATEVPAFFDLVLHMESAKDADGNPCRVWRTANSDGIIAKDASGALDVFEQPNWQSVYKKILVKKNGATT